MVDTINQVPDQNPVPSVSELSPASGNFYAGFNKPEGVNVNLAGMNNEEKPVEPTAPFNPVPSPEPLPQAPTQPATDAPKFSDFKPAQTPPPAVNNAYSTNLGEPINWRAVLFISGIGLLATIVLAVSSYFIAGAIYGKNYTTAQTDLEAATQKLTSAQESPTPLELPVVTPPSTNNTNNSGSTGSTTPNNSSGTTTNVDKTPIETPAATDNSSIVGQG